MEFGLHNLQAISEATISIPENSITEFSGDNSNGKSIISKVIQAVTSGDIKHKNVRRSLIKDGTDQAIFYITRGDTQLAVIIKEEQSESVIGYSSNTNDPNAMIFRSVADTEGCKNLIYDFGFRTYADGDICLQLSPTWGAIPFITTSGAVNNDIVQDITVDKVAQSFLDSFKTITYPTFKNKLKNLKSEKESIDQILGAMENYDWRAYKSLANEMQECLDRIRGYQFIEIKHLIKPTKIVIHKVYDCKIRKLRRVKLYQPMPMIPKLQSFSNLCTIRKGICPMCGRTFS